MVLEHCPGDGPERLGEGNSGEFQHGSRVVVNEMNEDTWWLVVAAMMTAVETKTV